MSDLSLRGLRTEDGRKLEIDTDWIARGGEGAIHRIRGHQGYLGKIYYDEPDENHVAKLRAMIGCDHPELYEAGAWPQELILESVDTKSKVIGFTMPEIVGHREIHQLSSPIERKRYFPEANWKMLALAASNLGRIVDVVHSAGCVIGDLNQNNVLVSSKATIRLIDCDSFQFRRSDLKYWTCDVGKEEYLPPELQSAKLRDLVREPQHDDFALAVLVFQLLFMGRHPFSGRHSRSNDFGIGSAIAEGAYFYGRDAGKKRISPPPGVITTAELPDVVSEAFECSFLSNSRPTAEQWSELMLEFARQLVPCELSSRHLFHPVSKMCPWCALKSTHRIDFFPVILIAESAIGQREAGLEFEITPEVLLQKVRSVPAFDRVYERPKIAKRKLRTPEPISSRLSRPEPPDSLDEPEEPEQTQEHALLFLLSALAWPTFLLMMIMMLVNRKLALPLSIAWGCLISLRILIAKAISRLRLEKWVKSCEAIRIENEKIVIEWNETNADWISESNRRNNKRDNILALLVDRENIWKAILESSRSRDELLRAEAESIHQRLTDRLENYRRELQEQSAARRAEAVEAWLENHLIRNASIPQIGRTRVAMLASFGIETAADVVRLVRNQHYAIPGFGQRLMNNLWYWAAEVQSNFNPTAFENLPIDISLKIKSRYEPEIRSMNHRMNQIAEELTMIRPSIDSKFPKVMKYLEKLTQEYLEADSDARLMEMGIRSS